VSQEVASGRIGGNGECEGCSRICGVRGVRGYLTGSWSGGICLGRGEGCEKTTSRCRPDRVQSGSQSGPDKVPKGPRRGRSESRGDRRRRCCAGGWIVKERRAAGAGGRGGPPSVNTLGVEGCFKKTIILFMIRFEDLGAGGLWPVRASCRLSAVEADVGPRLRSDRGR
jgi:hypothetical protein